MVHITYGVGVGLRNEWQMRFGDQKESLRPRLDGIY